MWARFLIKKDDNEDGLEVRNVDNIKNLVVNETGTTIYFNNSELVEMIDMPMQITIRKDWG